MREFVLMFNEAGKSIYPWIVFMNLWIGALFLLALILDRALRNHISASHRMLLYVPIFIRLLLPIGWDSPLSFTPEFTKTSIDTSAAQTNADFIARHQSVSAVIRSQITPRTHKKIQEEAFTTFSTPSSASHGAWFILVYLLGLVTIGLRRYYRYRNFKKLLNQAHPARAALQKLTEHLLPARVRLLEHEKIGPLVYGQWKPTVVIPTAIATALDDIALSCIMAHEAEHLRRRDPSLIRLMQFLTFVLWPVVTLWLGVRRLSRLAELTCDDSAVRRLPGIGYKTYGEVLLRVAEFRSLQHRFAPLITRFTGNELQERIISLGLGSKWPSFIQKSLILAIALLIISSSGVVKKSAFGQVGFPGDTQQGITDLELAVLELQFADTPNDFHICQRLVQAYTGLATDWYIRFRTAYSAGYLERMDECLDKTKQMSEKAWHYAQKLIKPYEDGRKKVAHLGEEAFIRWLNQRFKTDQASILRDVGTAWLTTIAYNDQSYTYIDLPLAEAMLWRSVVLDPNLLGSQGFIILGTIKCKMSATSGSPSLSEEGYELLKRVNRLTNSENQMIKVDIAEYCAPALKDRKLFVQLLQEVMNSKSNDRFTNSNQKARELSQYLIEELDTLVPDFK